MTTTCAENINVLLLLDETPSPPQTNNPKPANNETSYRAFSFEHESRLVRTIAFLAGISGDAAHVVAVCTEELPLEGGLRVVVAINKERCTSGDEVLGRIKDGLEKLFSLLSQANVEKDASVETQVFDCIIEMSQDRILFQLGCRKQGGKSKACLSNVVQQVIEAVRGQNDTTKPSSKAGIFIRKANALRELLDNTKAYKKGAVAPLKRILIEISRLLDAVDLPKTFRAISAKNLNPSTANGIVRRLKKLAKYKKSSHILFQLARKFSVFKKVSIIPVRLDPKWFGRGHEVPQSCCLGSCLSRCQTGAQAVGYEAICQKLKIEQVKARQDFLLGVKSTLKESKFHAEVQIIAHLELHPPAIKPRVIASSKDACYLCNLFIDVHGQFYVPKTHGKLYPGWRIPEIPALKDAQARLNKALEARIRKAITETMSATKPKLTIYPNESTVFSFSSSVSTIESTVVIQGTSGGGGSQDTGLPKDGQRDSKMDVVMQVVEVEPSRSSYVSLQGHLRDQRAEEHREQSGNVEAAVVPEPEKQPAGPVTLVHSRSPDQAFLARGEPLVEEASVELGEPQAELQPERPVSSEHSLREPSSVEASATEVPTAEVVKEPLILIKESPRDSKYPSADYRSVEQSLTKDQPSATPPFEPTNPAHEHSSSAPQPEPAQQHRFKSPYETREARPRPAKIIPLVQGQIFTHRLDIPSSRPFCYTTGHVTIYPELTHTSLLTPHGSWASTSGSPVEMMIHWLLPEEQTALLRGRNDSAPQCARIIPIDSIPDSTDLDVGGPERVYIAHGRDVVNVEIVRSPRR